MRIRRVGGLPGLIILLLLASCGEGSVFMPDLSGENEVTIETIRSGAILSEDGEIPVALRFARPQRPQDSGPDRLEIVLATADGEVLGTQTIRGAALREPRLPSVEIPNLDPGLYQISFRLYRNGEEVSRSDREFFFATGTYRVLGVSVYPPSFFPESTGLLRAQVEAPPDSDPYLRWTLGEQQIGEGYLSEGGSEVLVKSPREEGVYPVRVELFPTGPAARAGFDFPSTVSHRGEVVVQRKVRLSEQDLGPAESYYTLFHFLGNTIDDGMRMKLFGESAAEARTVGTPDLRIIGEVFGYYLDGEAGFRIDEMVLPVHEGRVSPFSLKMRLLLDGAQEDRVLFSARDAAGRIGLTLRLGPDGNPVLVLDSAQERVEIPAGRQILPADRGVSLSVSVVPQESETTVMWFSGGLPAATVTVDFGFGAVVDSADGAGWQRTPGMSVIGGEDGFRGIIDEFGVYFQDEDANPTTDGGLFRKAERGRLGDRLEYAEGFEGLTVPDELTVSGDVRVTAGMLVLRPGSSVLFPAFIFEEESLVLELDFGDAPAGAVGTLQFHSVPSAGEERPVLVLRTDGTVVLPAGRQERLGSPSLHRLALLLVHAGGVLSVTGPDGQVSPPLPEGRFEGLRMRLLHGVDMQVPFRLQSVSAYRERPSLSRSLNLGEAGE